MGLHYLFSYLNGNFALICLTIISIALFAALAWFLHNWRFAVAAGMILAAGFAYQHVDREAYARRVAEDAQATIANLGRQIKTMNVAADNDAKRAADDANRIAELETKLNETPPNNRVCLDRAGAGRVRDIR